MPGSSFRAPVTGGCHATGQALEPLGACAALAHLACGDNPLAALVAPPGLVSLHAQRAAVAGLADLRPLALAPRLAELRLAGNACVAGLSPRRRRVLVGNLLPGARAGPAVLTEPNMQTPKRLPRTALTSSTAGGQSLTLQPFVSSSHA